MKKYHYALVLEYSGTKYSGWQKQNHVDSVQSNLEKALSIVANECIEKIVCAGRTDSGVHATAQVVHFSTSAVRKSQSWILGINANLPKDINVYRIYSVNDSFNSRFHAVHRRYQYVIHQSKTKSALWSERAVFINQILDIRRMNSACQYILGEQDFSSFRSSKCQSKSTYRNIHSAKFIKKRNFIIFDIKGDGFLHHMVRNIVGSMIDVGLKKKAPESIKSILHSKDRRKASITSPPEGLYLIEVGYPTVLNIIASQEVPFL